MSRIFPQHMRKPTGVEFNLSVSSGVLLPLFLLPQ